MVCNKLIRKAEVVNEMKIVREDNGAGPQMVKVDDAPLILMEWPRFTPTEDLVQ